MSDKIFIAFSSKTGWRCKLSCTKFSSDIIFCRTKFVTVRLKTRLIKQKHREDKLSRISRYSLLWKDVYFRKIEKRWFGRNRKNKFRKNFCSKGILAYMLIFIEVLMHWFKKRIHDYNKILRIDNIWRP